jgi:hypothetical protein
MSDLQVGEFSRYKEGWQLVRRDGPLEMFHNHKSGSFEVCLYERESGDYCLLHAIMYSEDQALLRFLAVGAVLDVMSGTRHGRR